MCWAWRLLRVRLTSCQRNLLWRVFSAILTLIIILFDRYVLWKKKWDAKGFGFTLKGPLDFDAPNFVVEAETFEAFYGEAGDGNVYNPVNVSGYIRHVMTTTGNKGVHLMMADGVGIL